MGFAGAVVMVVTHIDARSLKFLQRKIAEDTGDKLSIQLLKELCSTPVSAMELLAKYVDLDNANFSMNSWFKNKIPLFINHLKQVHKIVPSIKFS